MRHIELLLKLFIFTLLLTLDISCNVHKPKVSIDIFDKENNKGIGKIELTGKSNLTEYKIELFELNPQKTFTIKLHSGDCNMLSSSSTIVSRITTDLNGNGTDSGILLFHNKEHILLNYIADGEHILVIESDTFRKCITIPQL